MKDKINTFKDYILKLAYDGKDIDYVGMQKDDKYVWQYYINELVCEGYIEDIGVVGGAWLRIKPKGTVHFLNGGLSGDKQKTSIDTGKYFDMFIGVLIEEGLSLLLGGVLEN
jgi:hypothetical protein